ncbi:MAG: hypothetical protein Q4D62_13365 [Planctomycetia bacterium]|nr:hypothetical protein [Planctomycetia bacterium]
MICSTRSKSRRGVVLLLVLAILATFGITALTFFLSTGQVKDSAVQNSQVGVQTFTPETYLEEAVMQVLRGPKDNSTSVIGKHSLLEDMYGLSEATGVEYHSLSFSEQEGDLQSFSGGDSGYVGRIITNVEKDSPSYGKSAIVIKYHGGLCYVLPQEDGSKLTSGNYLLNDRPFQGENDYDAPDVRNLFLAARDPQTGEIKIASYDTVSRSGTRTTESWEVDADNDGLKDSLWLDLGMPSQATADGRLFKPMFGIVVEDLDGRLNVNVCGGEDTTSQTSGMGRGPVEISLASVGSGFRAKRMAGTPPYATSSIKGPWYSNWEEISTNGTPYDILGQYAISLDENGFPRWDTTHKPVADGNCYDLNMGRISPYGYVSEGFPAVPFSASELERVLCSYDFTTPYLSQRLLKCLDSNGDARYLVTTESWHIPAIPENSTLESHIQADRNKGEDDERNFLPEIWAGYPIDLLRAATFDMEENADGTYTKRLAVARCIYNILTNLDRDENSKRRYAQWAVNIVDFLDQDSIITPFCYDGEHYVYGCERPELLISETFALHSRNTSEDAKDESDSIGGELKEGNIPPEDDTIYENYSQEGIFDKDGNLSKTWDELKEEYSDDKDVLGYIDSIQEKIEKMEKEVKPDGIIDFDQKIRPQGSLYVELYNPWMSTQEQHPQEKDIYDNTGKQVDLGKKNLNGDSVWRLVVMQPSNTGYATLTNWNSDKRDETELETGEADFSSQVERVINLGANDNNSNGISESAVVHHASTHEAKLLGGQFAVIGPEKEMVLSYSSDEEGAITASESLTLAKLAKLPDSGGNGTNGIWTIGVSASSEKLRMSVTEIPDYYKGEIDETSSMELSQPRDKPMDKEFREDWESIFRNNKIVPGYRIVHLQRLANPNLEYNSQTNPYITIDSMPVDLNVFNACSSEWEPDDVEKKTLENMYSRKRGEGVFDKKYPVDMIWQQEDWVSNEQEDILVERNKNCESVVQSEKGEYTGNVCVAFGQLGNKNYPFTSTLSTNQYRTSQPFPWLYWMNRAPISPMELLNVTYCSNARLLANIKMDTEKKEVSFKNENGLTGHLPEFVSSSTDIVSEVNRSIPIAIFHYLRVPSPQTVTPMVLNRSSVEGEDSLSWGTDKTLPFGCYSMFREPGRINVNTIYSQDILEALLGRTITQAEWSTFISYRGGTASSTEEISDSSGDGEFTVSTPFRTTYNSDTEGVGHSIWECDVFKPFAETLDTDSLNPQYHPYMRFRNCYRAANLATTRSNVFAVWITMGLIECNSDGTLMSMDGKYVELGNDTGNIKRYRAFYIIDRSIPVGFEQGKNHNVDRTILLRRYLQ